MQNVERGLCNSMKLSDVIRVTLLHKGLHDLTLNKSK